jgi:macrodomain Ter protein organizer (MatP/YcbG family)
MSADFYEDAYEAELAQQEEPTAPRTEGISATLQLTGYNEERVVAILDRLITERAERWAKYSVSEELKKRIEKEVNKAVDEAIKSRVKEDINAVLDEGWQLTNQYGEPVGERQSLRDRVRRIFEAKESSYDRQNKVEKWIQEAVNYKLGTVLNEEITAARKRLAEAFDEVIRAKFGEELRKLLGLR